MLVYPQLTQLPIVKRSRQRTVVNRLADGRSIRYGDPAATITEWQLQYGELGDEEIGALQRFFDQVEGCLTTFTFVDPTANLLVSSEALDGPAWLRGPLFAAGGGPPEWRLTNGGAAPQRITQRIPAPLDFTYCFS